MYLWCNSKDAKERDPGAPAVDIALKGGKVLVSGLSYENASHYLRLKPGKYDLEVRVAGTPNVVLNLPGVEVDAGKIYQVYAVGIVGGSPEFGVRVSMNDATRLSDKHNRRFEAYKSHWENRNQKFFNNHL